MGGGADSVCMPGGCWRRGLRGVQAASAQRDAPGNPRNHGPIHAAREPGGRQRRTRHAAVTGRQRRRAAHRRLSVIACFGVNAKSGSGAKPGAGAKFGRRAGKSGHWPPPAVRAFGAVRICASACSGACAKSGGCAKSGIGSTVAAGQLPHCRGGNCGEWGFC